MLVRPAGPNSSCGDVGRAEGTTPPAGLLSDRRSGSCSAEGVRGPRRARLSVAVGVARRAPACIVSMILRPARRYDVRVVLPDTSPSRRTESIAGVRGGSCPPRVREAVSTARARLGNVERARGAAGAARQLQPCHGHRSAPSLTTRTCSLEEPAGGPTAQSAAQARGGRLRMQRAVGASHSPARTQVSGPPPAATPEWPQPTAKSDCAGTHRARLIPACSESSDTSAIALPRRSSSPPEKLEYRGTLRGGVGPAGRSSLVRAVGNPPSWRGRCHGSAGPTRTKRGGRGGAVAVAEPPSPADRHPLATHAA